VIAVGRKRTFVNDYQLGAERMLVEVPNLLLRCVLVGMRFIVGPALAVMCLTSSGRAADIRVFSGGAPQAALQHLGPEFERATGHRLEFTFQLVTDISGNLRRAKRPMLFCSRFP
jgi:hypothetical protein